LATKRRRKRKIKARFFVWLSMLAAVIVFAVVLGVGGFSKNEITYGSIGSELEAAGAIIRDETVVTTTKFEKVTYNVIEGQTVENGIQVCEVYKRGYQDETMVTLLNLQKQIYAYQLQLLGGNVPEALTDVNNRIRTVEDQIRSAARGEAEMDMLALEQSLKSLLEERINTMRSLVAADATLNSYYTELENQKTSLSGWKQNVTNNAGTGIISFYFDGYESALNINKLSTANAALINSIVKGNNTTVTAEESSDIPLYRLIDPGHWMLAFVTDADDPMRLSAGEEYYVTFTDYSTDVYLATAREPVVTDTKVVNMLEFYTDIGKLVGVRTVNALITKSAQGLVVPTEAIIIENGVAGLNIDYGGQAIRVEIDVLADDGEKAVIRARNAQDTLAVGQKFIKP